MEIIKDIQIKGSADKPVLLDIYYIKNGAKKPVVIFCHGFKGFKDWGHWHLMAEKFAREGFLFIKFNFSHNGTTPEKPEEFADLEAFGNNNYSKELDDLGKVIDWISGKKRKLLEEEADPERVFLIGHSRGGGIAILKTNEDSRVKKAAALAPVSDFSKRWGENKTQWKKDGVQYVINSRTGQHMPLYYQIVEDYEKNKDRLNIPEAVKNLKKPLLLIHGTDDEALDYWETKNLAKRNKENTRLLIIEDANHVFGGRHPYPKKELPQDSETAVKEIIDFFKRG